MKKGIFKAKAEEMGERTVRFKISSEVVDRDGDILIAKGCDFTNFAKNPQFLAFHNYHEYPLGIPKNWGIEGDAVYCDVYFPKLEELATDAEQASEKAKLVDFTYHCYKTGMLNAVSVGFIPKDASPLKDGGMEITEWELLEFSAVSVPANQDALAQAVKSFGINENDLIDPVERIKSLEEKIKAIEDDTVLIVDDEIEIEIEIDKN